MLLRIILLAFLYGACLLETALINQPQELQIAWLYLVAGMVSWRLPPWEATVWGAVIGLAADALSPIPIGLTTAVLGTTTGLLANFRERWLGESLAAFGLLIMLGTAATFLGVTAGRALLGESIGTWRVPALMAAGNAAATALAGVAIAMVWRTMLYAAAANGLIRFPFRHVPSA